MILSVIVLNLQYFFLVLATSIPVEGPDTKLPTEISEDTLEESLEKV